jgi:uncharacterized protein (TIGR03437 family)
LACAPLGYLHIFSQEQQTRSEPRRLVRRVPSSAIPVLATDNGSNLANNTLDWTGLINNGQLPTSLGGVSVTIDGQSAYLYFVSPGQINLQAPAVASGDVQVVVANNGMSTAPVKVHLGTYAPAFFQWGPNQYAVTTRFPDN